MKRLVIVLGIALALSLVFVTGAFANFGPHGGYAVNTDACAGCHRAHSSFSTIQFKPKDPGATNPSDYPYALLVGSAGTMTEFCNACHGNNAIGASTNVVDGIFDSGPAGAAGVAIGADTDPGASTVLAQYVTNSTFGAGLNGGGFSRAVRKDYDGAAIGSSPATVTSAHMLSDPGDGALLPNWGFGASVQGTSLTCSDCHDPHGSTNYRLLKDNINLVDVSKHVFGDDDPANYPYADGWKRGADGGAAQMAAYVPDYTGGTKLVRNAGAQVGTLSEWCASCHVAYTDNESAMAYDWAGSSLVDAYDDPATGPGATPVARHRHPVDVPPSSGDAILQVEAYRSTHPTWVAARAAIPLERTMDNPAGDGPGPHTIDRDDYLGCLTCHVAHGSSQVMTGWASAKLSTTGYNMPERDDSLGGVDPTFSSALLRADQRTVCQACHEK